MTRQTPRPDGYAPSLPSNSAGLERHSAAGSRGRAPGLSWASAILLLAATAAHAGDAAVEAPVRQFAATINKGDVVGAKATHVASPVIIDEVAPYLWSGPTAFDAWLKALGAAESAEGKTDAVVALGTPIREIVSADHAYVVWPATYSFIQKKRPMRETAEWSFTLEKSGGRWKIGSWTWSTPEATRQHP